MTQLTSMEKAQIKFHYVLSGAFPFKLAQLSRVMDNVEYDSFELSRIQSAIATTDSAYNETILGGGQLVEDEKEVTEQDIVVTSELTSSTTTYGDRTKTTSRRASYQQRLNAYFKQVEYLSRLIGVSLW